MPNEGSERTPTDGGGGRGSGFAVRVGCIVCPDMISRGGRAAESTRGAGAWRCGSGPVSWVYVAFMGLNGRGRRGASAPVPYIYNIERG
jgi:hypothetical protein